MSGIYIHIPFCKSKCNYCNFYSVASLKHKDEYLNALKKEIILRKDYLQGDAVKTIYFGGGTPSLLSSNEINSVIDTISSQNIIAENPEITLEANPDDFDSNKIKDLKETAVNRISIGFQSFSDNDLNYLKRRHSSRQGKEALSLLQDAGYLNISADIIYGIPVSDNKVVRQNIEYLTGNNIPHISAYALTVEPETPLHKLISKGRLPAAEEAATEEQFMIVMETLKSFSYIHYEISNFCVNDAYSIHNSNYWKGIKYLGLGPSAHSFNIASRQWNISNLSVYINSLKSGRLSFNMETLSEKQKYNEYILLGLRTVWGCDTQIVMNRFGEEFHNHLKNEINKFLINGMIISDNHKFCLSQKGKLFADRIASELFII